MAKRWWAAALLGLSAAGLSAAQFIHTPVLSGAQGQPVEIQAALLGADNSGNVQVRLYYRQRGVEIYSSVVMGGPLASLGATIPGDQVGDVGVEYYLEADVYTGSGMQMLATYPASNPELNPVEVVVRRDLAAPSVTPLSPGQGESVDSSEPVITATFAGLGGVVDVASVAVFLDGRPAPSDGLQVYDTIVSYIPTRPLADGAHSVTVSVTNKAGHTGTASWSFRVGASAGENLASSAPWIVGGNLSLETQYGAVLQEPKTQMTGLPFMPYGANQASLSVTARGPQDTFGLRVYDTDMNRSDQQPLDRYTATWSNREGTLSLGDVSPSFSELSLYDLYELRGVDLDPLSGPADGGHTRFEGVWGQTQWAVNSGSGNLSDTYSVPTYAQYLYGARWEAGNPDFLFGLNAVTVNDDAASLNNPAGVVPNYNTVATADLKAALPFAWLSFSGEAGVDSFDAGQTLLGYSLGSAYKAGLLWDARPLGSRLTFEWRDLGGGFGVIPGGFSTMANPGLQSDYRGFESTFTQSLLQGRVNLDLAENNWRDNLDSTKPTTTTTNFLNALTTITPAPDLPYLTAGYSQTNVYNNGAQQIVDAGGNTLSQFVDQLTAVYNAAVGYSRVLGPGTGSVNVSYVGTDLTDMAPFRDVQDIQSWNVVLASYYGLGPSSFNATLGLGGSTDPAASEPAAGSLYLPTSNSTDLSAGLHWTRQWGAGPLSSSLGWDLVQTDAGTQAGAAGSGGPLLVQVNNNTRDTFEIGGIYTLTPAQKVNLQLSYAFVNAWVNLGTGQGTQYDDLTETYADLRYDLTF